VAKHLNLPRINGERKPREHRTRLDGETDELLEYYIQAYREEYGHAPKPGEMIAHIVKTQLTSDKKFRGYVRKAKEKAPARAGA